jgi:putative membrane protein
VTNHFDEATDATRRTRLANERTYLAWWRSGLTTLAVSFAAGRVVPDLTSGAEWPFEALGAAFAILGVAFIGYGEYRRRSVERALDRGDYAGLSDAAALTLAAAGLLLGVATLLVIVINP